MRSSLALLGFAGYAAAQAVTALISPTSPPPAGCTTTHTEEFGLSIVAGSGASEELAANFGKRQNGAGQLEMTLNNGVLKDSNGRQGYVASNFQFQFDGPPQAGAIYTAGFSICPNNTIALGGNDIWWSCSSGSAFDNLYDRNWAPYCKPVYFEAIGVSGSSSGSGSGSGSGSTGTVTGSSATGAAAGGSSATSATAATTPATNATTSATTMSTAASNSTMSSSSAATTSASSGSSSAAGGSGSSSSSPSPSSSASQGGAAGAMATELPQVVLPWAVGVFGVMAML